MAAAVVVGIIFVISVNKAVVDSVGDLTFFIRGKGVAAGCDGAVIFTFWGEEGENQAMVTV